MIKGLPRDCFVSEELFRHESEQIMNQSWVAVATTSAFDGQPDGQTSFIKVDFCDQSVLILHRVDDSFAAFHNICRHRGTRLVQQSDGTLKNDCITCPYHAWSYNDQGRLIGAPNMADVDDFDRSEFGLLPIACHVWAGMIFLHSGNANASFEADMQPLVSRLENWDVNQLEIAKTLTYNVKANWKLIFQNYSECYHCPTVHPDLNQQTPYKSATNDLVEGPILGGPMQLADGFETVSSDGKLVADVFENLDERQRKSIYYYTVFPNMFVSAHPDYIMIHQLMPVDVGNTRIQCHFLTMGKNGSNSIDRAWQMWDTVNRQDWNVCELTQQGVNSPAFQPGPYSSLEPMLVAFDRHYRDIMKLQHISTTKG